MHETIVDGDEFAWRRIARQVVGLMGDLVGAATATKERVVGMAFAGYVENGMSGPTAPALIGIATASATTIERKLLRMPQRLLN